MQALKQLEEAKRRAMAHEELSDLDVALLVDFLRRHRRRVFYFDKEPEVDPLAKLREIVAAELALRGANQRLAAAKKATEVQPPANLPEPAVPNADADRCQWSQAMTASDAAALYSVTTKTIREWIKSEKIKVKTISKSRFMIHLSDMPGV